MQKKNVQVTGEYNVPEIIFVVGIPCTSSLALTGTPVKHTSGATMPSSIEEEVT